MKGVVWVVDGNLGQPRARSPRGGRDGVNLETFDMSNPRDNVRGLPLAAMNGRKRETRAEILNGPWREDGLTRPERLVLAVVKHEAASVASGRRQAAAALDHVTWLCHRLGLDHGHWCALVTSRGRRGGHRDAARLGAIRFAPSA